MGKNLKMDSDNGGLRDSALTEQSKWNALKASTISQLQTSIKKWRLKDDSLNFP